MMLSFLISNRDQEFLKVSFIVKAVSASELIDNFKIWFHANRVILNIQKTESNEIVQFTRREYPFNGSLVSSKENIFHDIIWSE